MGQPNCVGDGSWNYSEVGGAVNWHNRRDSVVGGVIIEVQIDAEIGGHCHVSSEEKKMRPKRKRDLWIEGIVVIATVEESGGGGAAGEEIDVLDAVWPFSVPVMYPVRSTGGRGFEDGKSRKGGLCVGGELLPD